MSTTPTYTLNLSCRGEVKSPELNAKILAWTDYVGTKRHPANLAPRGFREVDADYIANHTRWGDFYPDATEFRQCQLPGAIPPEDYLSSVYLHYFFDGTGVAWTVGVERDTATGAQRGRLRWFIFGCTSEKHTIHHCPDCGHVAHFDSSD